MTSFESMSGLKKITVTISQSFSDQKPGTSGLRKSTKRFLSPNYLENYVESIFRTLPGVEGGTLIIGGDGRYGNKYAIQVILRMAAAHGISKVISTTNGILSTPAASNLIRNCGAIGGIILSASHNPGGLDADFGVKLNGPNGGPASEALSDAIYACTKNIDEYYTVDSPKIDLSKVGNYRIGGLIVEIIDGVDDYIKLMENIFDFDQIRKLISSEFHIVFDALNAVTGPYAKRILEDLLKAPKGTVRNSIPLEDFGGAHPDPNLTYAKDIADLLLQEDFYSFGAACDGDGDRNMILGRSCFVNPSDSLAVLTANSKCVPAYSKGIVGVARSMPTSAAVDVVAKDINIPCYETPTGWKYFGNLLDKNQITLCGEESFGTGSNHIREKDGLWAVLFWLQILAHKKCSVSELMTNHWITYGRHFYSRHDYEEIPSDVANKLYSRLESILPNLISKPFGNSSIIKADNFSYTDPIDNSISSKQGLRILLKDGSRVILRLSGTGTKGSTLRIYFEKYINDNNNLHKDPQFILSDLIHNIDSLAEIRTRTEMERPTVIT